MLELHNIVQLFENVLKYDMVKHNIPIEAVKLGIEAMAHVYRPETGTLSSERSTIADYTDVAHRCAYLHKYAGFHTAMVLDMLYVAVQQNYDFFHRLVYSDGEFRLCSLGGGPGTDVIGALAALHAVFSYFPASATVIDYMVDWSFSFDSILRELGTGMYGAFGNNTSYFLNWRYVGANLLKSFNSEVNEALYSASLVTMIKFVSATTCQDTKIMIKNIFGAMRPGAAVLYIDNDGGGFHNLMKEAATDYNFISIFGPHRRENYVNHSVRIRRFGYLSCFKTTVTVHILQKPFPISPYCDIPYAYNGQFINAPFMQRPLLRSPPSLLGSPLTPMLYHPECNYYAQDENIHSRDFLSPVQEIPQSPRNVMPSYVGTPLTNNIVNSPMIGTPDMRKVKRGKKRTQGCFPLRIKSFRHHLARKVDQVKSRAQNIFKKGIKSGKAHPIFRL